MTFGSSKNTGVSLAVILELDLPRQCLIGCRSVSFLALDADLERFLVSPELEASPTPSLQAFTIEISFDATGGNCLVARACTKARKR